MRRALLLKVLVSALLYGAVIAAISVSGPIDRMGRRPGERWATDLLAAAEALTRRL